MSSLDVLPNQKDTHNPFFMRFLHYLISHNPSYDEAASQLDDVRRENRSLSDEIKDLMEQISEGGRSIHEIEKQRKKLEAEKGELEAALGDAEAALEQEENKFLRLSLEINQVGKISGGFF